MFNKNRGFSSVALIIIVLIVLGGGYWMWQKQLGSEASKLPPAIPSTPASPASPNRGEPAGGPSVDMTDWKTYRNERYGFEFKYPNQKILKESGNLVSIRNTEEPPDIFNVMVEMFEGTASEAFVRDANIYSKERPYHPVTNEGKITVDGTEGIKTQFCGSMDCYQTIYITHNHSLYKIYVDKQDQILSTFRFTK